MGNACGKTSEVREASRAASAVQPSPPTDNSSKAEASANSVKKEQREEKNKVHWSIPAEPSAKAAATAQVEAQQAASTVQETTPGQP